MKDFQSGWHELIITGYNIDKNRMLLFVKLVE